MYGFQHPSLREFNTPPAGRPTKNLGKFILKPTDSVPSGAMYLNAMPSALKAVHEQYTGKFELPPALQPTYLRRPAVLQGKTNKAISKGFNNPGRRY
jgi:hypothetical protein